MALAKGRNRANLILRGDRIVVEVKHDADGSTHVYKSDVLTPTAERDIRHVTVASVKAEQYRDGYSRRARRVYRVYVDLGDCDLTSWAILLDPVETVLVGDPFGAKPRKVKAVKPAGSTHQERVTAALTECGWTRTDERSSSWRERWELTGHRPLLIGYTSAGVLKDVGHPTRGAFSDGPTAGKLAWVLDEIAAPSDIDPADHAVTCEDDDVTYGGEYGIPVRVSHQRNMTCACGWHTWTGRQDRDRDGATPDQRNAEQFTEYHGFAPQL